LQPFNNLFRPLYDAVIHPVCVFSSSFLKKIFAHFFFRAAVPNAMTEINTASWNDDPFALL